MAATINNRVLYIRSLERSIFFLFSKLFLLFLLAKLPLVKLIYKVLFLLQHYFSFSITCGNSPSFFVQIPPPIHIHPKNSNTKHKSQSFDQSKPCNYGIKMLFSRKAIRRKRKDHGVFQTWV